MTEQKTFTHLNEMGRDTRKCKIHNMWMKKGMCSVCKLEKMKAQELEERTYGSNKQEIKITKL